MDLYCFMAIGCASKPTISAGQDVAFIDKSFGFDTAVAEAVRVIQCGLIEADDANEASTPLYWSSKHW